MNRAGQRYYRASARTYYVDATAGAATNTGTAENQAYQTIATVNALALKPGDRVLLKAGEHWHETLTCAWSGKSGRPIQFGKYGSGSNPLIYGADPITGWDVHGGNVYKVQINLLDVSQKQLFQDGVRLRLDTAIPIASGGFYLDTATSPDTLYAWCTDDADPDTHTMEYTNRQWGVNFGAYSYLTFDSIDVSKTAQSGYAARWTGPNNYLTVQNCDVGWAGLRNVDFGNHSGQSALHNYCTVRNVVAHDGLGESIGFWFATGCEIIDCTAYNAGKDNVACGYPTAGNGTGLRIGINSVNCAIKGCYVHDIYVGYSLNVEFEAGYTNPADTLVERNLVVVNQATGFFYGVLLMGTGTVFRNNLVRGTIALAIVGVDGSTTSGTLIYHNTITGDTNAQYLVQLWDGTTAIVKNNVIARTAGAALVRQNAADAGVVDNNQYYAGGNSTWRYLADSYTAFADWKTNSSQDASSSEADPTLVNMGVDDHLVVGSPCINAGANLGVLSDYDQVVRDATPDIGAYQYVA